MSFEEALAEYGRLRQAYSSGQLSPQDFAQRVQQLQVRDANNTYWAIDGSSGNWLRFDGSNWVPGQPPIAQSPVDQGATQIAPSGMGGYGQPQAGGYGSQGAQQGGYGGGYSAPQPGGFNAPQQGGFNAPQSGGYSPQPQAGYAVPQAPTYNQPATQQKGGRNALIAILSVIGVLVVLAIVAVVIIAATGNLPGSGSAGLTEAAIAKSVDDKSLPKDKATEFTVGQEVFITYKANKAKNGQYVDLKLFRNNEAVTLQDTRTTFNKDSTYNGYYSYAQPQAGSYRVELYFNGEASPSQTLTFTVK